MSVNNLLRRHKKSIISLLYIWFILSACSIGAKNFNPQAVLLANPHKQDASWLVWSPDGKSIAISYWSSSMDITDQYSAVYILDVVTKDYRLIIQDTIATIAQSWSPDSEEFLFYSAGGNYSQGIWKVRQDGAVAPSFIADGSYSAWSRLGEIAILSMKNRDITFRVLAPESQWDEFVFQNVGKEVDGLSWSPDSTNLVFSMNNDELSNAYNLFIVDLTTNKLVQLTTGSDNHRPAWSPTSDMIVYEKVLPNEYEYSLFITNSEGSCEVSIPGTTGAYSPSWSPDGTKIAFLDLDGKIYSLDLSQVFGSDFLAKGLVCPNK